MERLRVAVGGENAAQVTLQALQTKARATRSIYESFLMRATQLANVAGIQEPDASLVSAARPPLGPSGPQIVRLVALASVLSLALGVGLACLMERLCRGFSLPEQVEAILGLPLLALLPTVPREALRGQQEGRAGIAFTASLDNLRGQMRALGETQPKLVMVTSSLPQEGKSVFAAEFARNAAAAGRRVLLIECDFCRPSLANHFDIAPEPGLCAILSGDLLGSSSSIIHELGPRLDVIVSGNMTGDSQELLASNRMAALLAAVRARYDLVVLDTPPVLPVADALVLARQADATLMVVRWEKTARPAVQDAVRRLRESRARSIGMVMTRVNLRMAANAPGRMSHAFSHYGTYHIPRAERG
jgi:capsular exopolysaccharide synthesis family protein